MAHRTSFSQIGHHRVYESGDQKNYGEAEISSASALSGVNTRGYLDQNKIVNELHELDTQKAIDDRVKHEPGFAATMHGNKPSKGARIDAEIAKEEAEMLQKK